MVSPLSLSSKKSLIFQWTGWIWQVPLVPKQVSLIAPRLLCSRSRPAFPYPKYINHWSWAWHISRWSNRLTNPLACHLSGLNHSNRYSFRWYLLSLLIRPKFRNSLNALSSSSSTHHLALNLTGMDNHICMLINRPQWSHPFDPALPIRLVLWDHILRTQHFRVNQYPIRAKVPTMFFSIECITQIYLIEESTHCQTRFTWTVLTPHMVEATKPARSPTTPPKSKDAIRLSHFSLKIIDFFERFQLLPGTTANHL